MKLLLAVIGIAAAAIAGTQLASEAPADEAPAAAPAVALASAPASAPQKEPDVIYVPTPQPVVEAMLKMAGVNKGDVLYDLGSGDGRIPITAAKLYGVRAVGIDIAPQRIA